MLLEYTDAAASRVATTITRRTMLRRAGAAALGTGLWGLSAATPLAEANGSPSHPCGPSPYCLSGRCFNGQCSNAAGRHYSTYSCWPNHLGGCWNEDYRSTGQGLWSCCDCCSFDHLSGATQCSSCGDSNTRWACICHKKIG